MSLSGTSCTESMDAPDRLPRSFIWLNVAQFFGALNDNLFKLFIIFYVVVELGDEAASKASGYAGLIFVVPFLVFCGSRGCVGRSCEQAICFGWCEDC